jgi:type I restriction-modification system DNA methylase subunit
VNDNGTNLGFEAPLFLATDKLRKNLEPSDYRHIALGLISLKHISNAFEAKQEALLAEDPAAAEDLDEYLTCKTALYKRSCNSQRHCRQNGPAQHYEEHYF